MERHTKCLALTTSRKATSIVAGWQALTTAGDRRAPRKAEGGHSLQVDIVRLLIVPASVRGTDAEHASQVQRADWVSRPSPLTARDHVREGESQ